MGKGVGFVFSASQAVTANANSANAPSVLGLENADVFISVASDGAWAGITQLDVAIQTSADGATWVPAKDSGGTEITFTFTADGADYALLNPAPGKYLRLVYTVTGTGDTVTVDAVGVGRK